MNTNICKTKRVALKCGSFQTPRGIKLYRSAPQYNPYNVIYQKSEIIENEFQQLFNVRFRIRTMNELL